MKYVFPAVFEQAENGYYAISFPDLPGCNSQGRTLYEAIDMAEAILQEWLEFLLDEKQAIPKPFSIQTDNYGKFVSLVRANIKARGTRGGKTTKRLKTV